MNQPLLPARLAVDSIEEIKGFVAALLYTRKTSTYESIQRCLFEDDPMIKGPFISLGLPFVRDTAAPWPLDPLLKEGFSPYAHQQKAFARLSGPNPQHTLITTGTGSGKSECFILPILDYVIRCKRQGKSRGVKALIVYPMNALIEDQGERLSELANRLNAHLHNSEHIRVGRYTGSAGNTVAHDPDSPKQIIDDRDALCKDPPDILLTNYKMLDFMLFRPQEQEFWQEATQDVFRYLVLDELHTFDGAQGADVACLIRRLRLKIQRDFTCVGTSATVAAGGTDDANAIQSGYRLLCQFAGTLFGAAIGMDAILGEERLQAESYLHTDPTLGIPNKPLSPEQLQIHSRNDYQSFLLKLCQHWSAPVNEEERGLWIRSHPLTKRLLDLDLAACPLDEIARQLEIKPELLTEFLDLLASARVPGRPSQVLNLSVQIWVSETGYLLRKLTSEPQFKRFLESNEDDYLPAVNCQSCGLSGWFTLLDENRGEPGSFRLERDTRKLFESFFRDEGAVLFVRGQEDGSKDPHNTFCYDPDTTLIYRRESCEGQQIPLHLAFLSERNQTSIIVTPRRQRKIDRTRCPECDDPLQLSFSGVSRSMLSSVLTSHFLAHGANPDDRKLLLFNDSVQDTAHQAGYISARSYRFNVRRLLYRCLHDLRSQTQEDLIPLADFRMFARTYFDGMWQEADRDKSKRRQLLQLIPRDLWEIWTTRENANPLKGAIARNELIDRISWEFWLELSLGRNLGWSLGKSGLVGVAPAESIVDQWVSVLKNCLPRTQIPEIMDPKNFVRGLLERFLIRGAVFHPDLEPCYREKHYSLWPL